MEIGAIVVVGIVGVLIAYVGNQLPPVSQFAGRNWLLARLLVWLVLIAIAAQALTQTLSDGVKIGVWCALSAAVVAMIFDISKLLGALRRTEATEHIHHDPPRASSDRDKLLKEASRQVRKRLEYAFGDQALINLAMQPQQDAVEGECYQGNTVFLVPQPQQSVENFSNSRLRVVASEETILDTFEHDDIAGQLLILGAPGSGKTTTLLKLAESLLDRAEGTNDIPYIFELSAWRDDKQDIAS